MLIIAAAVALVGWLLIVYPRAPGPGQGGRVQLELEPGIDVDTLAQRLAARHVIADPTLWSIYVRLLGADDRLRSGSVLLADDMTPADVTRHVARGLGMVHVRVTIPEGLNRFEIAERLERLHVCEADELIEATADTALLERLGVTAGTAEGYLFPDTYEWREGLPAQAVLGRLVHNFRRRVMPLLDAQSLGLARERADLGWSLHEVLTLASIVEKEAAHADERPRIAGVFLNRLRSPAFHPRRLQADPTVRYGCLVRPDISQACRLFDGRHITRAMLQDSHNPYNTYRIDGLPPGPIANPGLDAIRAVLAPETHGYFYFVARGGGRHHFSATLAEHNRAVARYRSGG